MINTLTLPSSLAADAPAVPTDLLIGESWREGSDASTLRR